MVESARFRAARLCGHRATRQPHHARHEPPPGQNINFTGGPGQTRPRQVRQAQIPSTKISLGPTGRLRDVRISHAVRQGSRELVLVLRRGASRDHECPPRVRPRNLRLMRGRVPALGVSVASVMATSSAGAASTSARCATPQLYKYGHKAWTWDYQGRYHHHGPCGDRLFYHRPTCARSRLIIFRPKPLAWCPSIPINPAGRAMRSQPLGVVLHGCS